MVETKKATPQGATQKQGNSNTKSIILSILKKRKRGYSRQELSNLTGLTDGVVRKAIGELRDEGYLIGTRPDGGYSYGNEGDFIRTIQYLEGVRNTESKRIRNMKRTLELRKQVKFDV